MKTIALYFCTIIMAIMILQQNYKIVCAGEVYDESGKYRLKVWLADPAYSPKVPKLSDENIANKNGKPVDKNLPNDITVNFRIALELKDPQRGFEDVRRRAKNTTKAVVVTGDGFSIKKVATYARLYSDEYRKFTNTQEENMPASLKVVTRAFEAGTKTVTLTVKTTIDDIELETSETLEFFVPNYIFDVFIKNGREDTEYYYDSNKFKSYQTVLDVGHAAWAIEVYRNQLSEISEDINTYANHVWGSGPKSLEVLDQAFWNFADTNDIRIPLKVSAPGQLYKDGDQGTESIRFAFDDTKNGNGEIIRSAKEKMVATLNHTRVAAIDPFYQYIVPDLNCVVQVIRILQVADLPMPNAQIDCEQPYKIVFKRGRSKRKEFKLSLPIPRLFLKKLEELDTQIRIR